MFVVGLCEELVLPVNKCKDLGVVLGFSFLYKHSLSFAQHLLHPVFSVSLYPNVIHIEQTNDLSGCFVAKQVFHLTWRLTDWQCSNRVKSQFYVRRGGIQGGAKHPVDTHAVSQEPKQSSVLFSRPAASERLREAKWLKSDRRDFDLNLTLDTQASAPICTSQEAFKSWSIFTALFGLVVKNDVKKSNGQPQVYPKWDHFSERYFLLMILIYRL